MLRTSAAAFAHRSARDLVGPDSTFRASAVALKALATTFVLAIVLCAGLADGQGQVRTEAAREGQAQYEVITQGLLANRPLTVEFRSAQLRLEIRDFIVGPGEARGVLIRGRTLMEVRGGGVTTLIDGEKQQRRPGDFWTVNEGSSLSLQNTGDVAVIRTVRIIEGPK